jgi:hypothetical protein
MNQEISETELVPVVPFRIIVKLPLIGVTCDTVRLLPDSIVLFVASIILLAVTLE